MYKTVRQGENSLQYTILPQQDESTTVNNAHQAESSLCRSRGRSKRGGRTTTIIIVTLLLVCSIAAGTILVPLLLTTDIIAFHKLQANSNINNNNHIIHHHSKVGFRTMTTPRAPVVTTPPTTEASTTSALTADENMNTLTTGADLVASTNKSYLEDVEVNATVGAPEASRNVTDDVEVTTTATTTTTTTTTATTTTRKNEADTVVTQEEIWIVKATRAGGDVEEVTTTVAIKTEDPYRGWLPPRWPFADPSSYLQWTGYTSGHDSLLLPFLLGLVLLVLIVTVGLCYFLRRRHQKFLRRAAIGKMSSDLQSDESADKASLLPEINSDEE